MEQYQGHTPHICGQAWGQCVKCIVIGRKPANMAMKKVYQLKGQGTMLKKNRIKKNNLFLCYLTKLIIFQPKLVCIL